MEKEDKASQILHFTSLFVFVIVWVWLSCVGAFRDGSIWVDLGFFVMGVSFAVGLLTRKRSRVSGGTN